MTIVLVMGVSGCGKTTIARALADGLGWHFQEGDALHPPANVAKMAGGTPLTDEDRWPWLRAITNVMHGWHQAELSGVVTCSALRTVYRAALLRDVPEVRLVYLHGDQSTIATRLAARTGHFMPPGLLNSQFAVLEPPGEDERPVIVSINRPPEIIVADLFAKLS